MKISKAIVTQNFALINAKYKLSTMELKFILNAISHLDSVHDTVLQEYSITVKEIEEEIGIGKEQHSRLKTFAKKLMSKPLLIEQKNGDFEVYNWFSRVRYISDGAYFNVRFEEGLKPYLLELKERFIPYSLKNILPLTSAYSIRIYQLLKEYENLEKRTFNLEELQEVLQVPKSYKIYNRFKDKVLHVAEKELKEHCDIYFTFSENKRGRKVSEIVFKIHSNESHTVETDIIEVHKQSNLKNYLKSISPFYFQAVPYKINNKGYLMQSKRILTTEEAKEMYKTFQDNFNSLTPCDSINIFDEYENEN